MDDANMQFVFENFLLNGCCLAKRQCMYMVPLLLLLLFMPILSSMIIIWSGTEVKRVLKPGGRYIFIEHVAANGIMVAFLVILQWGYEPLSALHLFFFSWEFDYPCLCRWDTSQIITAGCWSFATIAFRWLPSLQGNGEKNFWGWIFGCKCQHGIRFICLSHKSACVWSSFQISLLMAGNYYLWSFYIYKILF